MAYQGDGHPIVGARDIQLHACLSGICGHSRRKFLAALRRSVEVRSFRAGIHRAVIWVDP